MATRLTLLCHGATRSMREGGFSRPDEPLDADGLRKAKAARLGLGKYDLIARSPAAAARQTVEALALPCAVDERLDDLDHGQWQGLCFEEIHARDPAALAAWLADPGKGTPGGESMASARERLRDWLAEQARAAQAVLAVTHPMTIRAALSAALGLTDQAVMRFDIAPLSLTILSCNREWRLQTMGR